MATLLTTTPGIVLAFTAALLAVAFQRDLIILHTASSGGPERMNGTTRKRIVLTGATGFLGQHTLAHLLAELDDSYELFALHSGNSGSTRFQEAVRNVETSCTVHVDSLDLTDSSRAQEWVASHTPLDLCLHTAAISSPKVCQEDAEKAKAVNNPLFFLEALVKHQVPTVVLSSDQAYDGSKATLYTEADSANPVNIYGQTKVALEETLQSLFASKNVPYVALRSSILSGPHAPLTTAHGTFLHFIASRESQETTFYTDEIRNLVSVSNVANVLLYFVTHGLSVGSSGIYNMGGKDRASRFDMAAAVFRHLNYDPKFLIAATKATMASSGMESPLDISMDSSKLEKVTGVEFSGLDKIVEETFPLEN